MSGTICDALFKERAKLAKVRIYTGSDEACASFRDIAATAAVKAQKLNDHLLYEGAPVVITTGASLETLVVLLSAWAIRSPVCFVSPELRRQAEQEMPEAKQVFSLLAPGAIVVGRDEHTKAAFASVPSLSATEFGVECAKVGPCSYPELDPKDVAVLQLTSGSTGVPRIVPIRHKHLLASCAGVQSRAAIDARDNMVSWLPLFHDMGLAAITNAIWGGADLTLLPTDTFTRRPLLWLSAMSRYSGTLSPAPATSYGLMARLARRVRHGDLDLSSARYLWAGAEPVFPGTIAKFESAFAAFGLAAGAIKPAYGLAEAVVAVTGYGAEEPRRVTTFDRAELSQGRVLQVESEDGVSLVSNGRPIDCVAVSISDGSTLASEAAVGEIHIEGTAVPEAYLGGGSANLRRTGDLGFVCDGHLYVVGRAKDLIIRGGRKFAAHHVEECVEAVLQARAGSSAAIACLDHQSGRETTVVVLEGNAPSNAGLVRERLCMSVATDLGLKIDAVVWGGLRKLPRTTSGKLRRDCIRRMYMEGMLSESQERYA